ncbi:hypothetical protein Dda_3650 [Drechslerella dactyloides]|uniref:Uncharacterized protein n=1 Tax=Drechslerella dactyloides TaxID=74499 RepID=A0AAD6J0N2_DREDA|nr:hypothetical protein Dda_3650 [Drechslerella dactyloides]
MQRQPAAPSSRQGQPGHPGKLGRFDGPLTPPASLSSGQHAATDNAPAQVILPKGAQKVSSLIETWSRRSGEAPEASPKPAAPRRIGPKLEPKTVVRQKIAELNKASTRSSNLVQSRIAAYAKLSEAGKTSARDACLKALQRATGLHDKRPGPTSTLSSSSSGSVRQHCVAQESGDNSPGGQESPALAIAGQAADLDATDPAPAAYLVADSVVVAERKVRLPTEFPDLEILSPVPTRLATIPVEQTLRHGSGSAGGSAASSESCSALAVPNSATSESQRLFRELTQMTMTASAVRHYRDWHSTLPTVERHPRVRAPTFFQTSSGLSVGVGAIPPLDDDALSHGTATVFGTRRFRQPRPQERATEARSVCRVPRRLADDTHWRKDGGRLPSSAVASPTTTIRRGDPFASDPNRSQRLPPFRKTSSALPIAKYYVNDYTGAPMPERIVSPSPTVSTTSGTQRAFPGPRGYDGASDRTFSDSSGGGRFQTYLSQLRKSTIARGTAPPSRSRLVRVPGYAEGLSRVQTRAPLKAPRQTEELSRRTNKPRPNVLRKMRPTSCSSQKEKEKSRSASAPTFPRIPKLRGRVPGEKTALWMDAEWPLGNRASSC